MEIAKSILFFKTQAELRKWFQQNYLNETEAWIGFYNKKSNKIGITWKQLVDEALCFGWIDGIRKKIDDDCYCNRITPRKKKSNWSAINIQRIQELIDAGLVSELGKQVFFNRDLSKQQAASYEHEQVVFPDELLQKLKSNKKAWQYFEAQSNSYKKAAIVHVMGAKQLETQLRRMEILINDSENHLHLKHLRRTKVK